ncbi:co-chaperone GroES [Candidatus Saccharibacteria bacterium]|nr:co-chaperone GroES [Candidatus Saccharibacteria bacterium]MCB9834560.1 co-chaperone GroES [Candidatus Nomurabacteria bacterium]
MGKVSLKPLADRVVLEKIEVTVKSPAGIILPENAQEKTEQGKVLAIGVDVKELKVGQVVLYSQYGPTNYKIEGQEILLLKEEDVLAVVE